MRRGSVSLACAMLLFTAASAGAAPATVTRAVRLHVEPLNNSATVMVLPTGSVVNVFDCANGWCRVAWGRNIGYMARRFLGLDAPPVIEDHSTPLIYSWHRGWRHRYWHHQWYSERETMTIRR